MASAAPVATGARIAQDVLQLVVVSEQTVQGPYE